MKKEVQIGNFCFSNPQESNAYSSVYITKPTEKFLQKFGRLAILSNISFKSPLSSKINDWAEEWIEKMANLAKSNFYQTRPSSISLEENLENLLQQLNVWLSQEKVSQPKIFDEKIESYDFAIIALKDKEVQFSQIGTIKTILIEGQSSENLGEEKKPNKTEKFINIISGNLQKDNILFFANEEVFDYFSIEKIIQVLKNTPPEQIQKEFQNLIKEDSPNLNMLGLSLSTHSTPSIKTKEGEPEGPKTEKKEKTKETKKEKTGKSAPSTSPSSIPLGRKKMTSISRPRNKQKKWLTRILLGGLFVCIVLFVGSIMFLKQEQKIAKEREQYAQALNELEKKQEELNVALLSSMEGAPAQVGRIFQDIESMIQSLPRRNEEEEILFQELSAGYKEKFNNFYKIIEISSPQQITDLRLTDPDIKTQGWALIEENFYIFNPENNYIYRFNLNDNQAEIINKTSANVGYLQKIYLQDEDSLIGYDQNQNLVEFNIIDNELSKLGLNTGHPKTEISDFRIYNRRLYVLRPTLNQIYKYQKTIDGFGQEGIWLQNEDIDISQGISLAIDGSIYVLQKNGSVEKLYQGEREENFNLEYFQPKLSLSSAGKILTNDKLNKIYILDPENKRVIILNKQGQLEKQLIFSSLNEEIKDFGVHPQENKIWILSDYHILEIEIEL